MEQVEARRSPCTNCPCLGILTASEKALLGLQLITTQLPASKAIITFLRYTIQHDLLISHIIPYNSSGQLPSLFLPSFEPQTHISTSPITTKLYLLISLTSTPLCFLNIQSNKHACSSTTASSGSSPSCICSFKAQKESAYHRRC